MHSSYLYVRNYYQFNEATYGIYDRTYARLLHIIDPILFSDIDSCKYSNKLRIELRN